MRPTILKRNEIFRDLVRLVSGTLGGRLIMLAALPLGTRLYSPDDFSLLAVYLGIISMASVVVCLRFDIAIPLAANHDEAIRLLILALGFAGGIALLICIPVLLFPRQTAILINQPRLESYIWMVPAGIFLAAAYSALQFWATRARRFGSIALSRFTQSTVGVFAMLALGWVGYTPIGLIIGNILNFSSGSVRFLVDAFRLDHISIIHFRSKDLVHTFRNYYRYPLYSTPEALASVSGLQIPVLIIAAYSSSEAGYLLIAQQIINAPISLLGSSIAQVYMSRLPSELQAGRLSDFTGDILLKLIQIGVIPIILAGLVAPFAFPVILGSSWERSGEIVALMVPWITLQFIASPVSMVLNITGRQHWALSLHVFGIFLRIFPILIVLKFPIIGVIDAFIIGSTVFYSVYIWVVIKAAGISLKKVVSKYVILLFPILSLYIFIVQILK